MNVINLFMQKVELMSILVDLPPEVATYVAVRYRALNISIRSKVPGT